MTRPWLFALCVLSCVAAGCGRKAGSADESPEPAVASDEIHVPGSALRSGELVLELVEARPLADTLVVTGEVNASPTRTAHVSTRVSGTIQTLTIVAGARVRAGDVLATMYSSEFLAAEGDFLLAHERVEHARASGSPDTATLAGIANSSRRRLEFMGADASDLDRLHQSHESIPYLPLRSPIDGVVTEAEAATGRQVAAGTDLFGISNLSSVWAVVDVYERDLGRVRVGQSAIAIANAFPDREFRGHVASLEGAMQAATRTLPVRIELPNPDLLLRPGMFVNARVVTGEVRSAVLVSESALQEMGGQKVVFVARDDSTFVPRAVQVRSVGGNLLEVLGGIEPGERIVGRGAFLVKSQASKSELGEE